MTAFTLLTTASMMLSFLGAQNASTPPPEPLPTPPPPPAPIPASARPPILLQVAPFGGIQFLGSVGTPRGDLDVGFSSVWGAAFRVHFPMGVAELSYTLQPTSLSITQPFGADIRISDMTVHHVLAGFGYEYAIAPYFRPFVGFALGLAVFNPHAALSSETRFATAFQAGADFPISERIGVYFLGRLTTAFFGSGSTVFCGFGGCSYGLFGGGVTQLGFMLGPTVTF
jgi:hypothetical protein